MNKFRQLTTFFVGITALFALSSFTPGTATDEESEPVQGPKFEDYFNSVTTPSAAPDNEGFIRRWTVLEPISKPNRSNTVFTDSYLRDAFTKSISQNSSL